MTRVFTRRSAAALEEELHRVEAEIAKHPFASDAVVAANALIDASPDRDREQVSAELAQRHLPDLEQLGRIHARGTVSWWRLHRSRNRLLTKISRVRGRTPEAPPHPPEVPPTDESETT